MEGPGVRFEELHLVLSKGMIPFSDLESERGGGKRTEATWGKRRGGGQRRPIKR